MLEVAQEAEAKPAIKRPCKRPQKRPIEEIENEDEDNKPIDLSSASECESVIYVERARRSKRLG